MKVLKSVLFLALLAFGAVSCSDDDDDTPTTTTLPSELGGEEVTGAVTLDASVDYTMNGALTVADGGVLTIPAGTSIIASGGTASFITVEQGGQIIVAGTAAEPVEISAGPGASAGDWGGLILLGRAPITNPGPTVPEIGGTASYGGTDPEDDSGSINYLILRHTGAAINEDAQHNGLALYGVGRGTTVSNVALFESNDDAIEFFGGTVNASNVMVVNTFDDMLDWTQGWTGTMTNFYGVQEAGYTPGDDSRGIEADGNFDGDAPAGTPQSDGTVNGITIAQYSTSQAMNLAMRLRRLTKATVTNALVVQGDGASFQGFIDLTDGAGCATDDTSVEVTTIGVTNAGDISTADDGGCSSAATISVDEGAVETGADAAAFSWTGYSFPAFPAQ